MTRLFPLPVVAALAATLAAQDAGSPLRFIPADSSVIVRMSGPGAWSEAFRDTGLAKLLAGPTLKPWMSQLSAGFDQGIEELRKEGQVDADQFRELLTSWSGELAIGVSIDWSSLREAIANEEPPRMGVVLAMTGDGKVDLKALAESVGKFAEEQTKLRDLAVGDHTLRVGTEDGIGFSMPVVVGDAVVMLVGTDLESLAAKVLSGENSPTLAPAARAGNLGVHLDCATAIEHLRPMVSEMGDENGAPIDIGAMLFDQLGLGSLGQAAFHLGAVGKYVSGDFSIDYAGAPTGVFKAIAPTNGKLSRLLGWRPAAASTFSTSPIDIGAIYTTVAEIWDGLADVVPMTRADGEASFAEMFKVRLKEDLVDLLGSDLLVVQDTAAAMATAAENDPEENPLAGLAAMCWVLEVRDGKQLDTNIEKLIRSRGLHSGRKSEDYQGVKVHRLNLGVAALEYAITEDALLVGPDDEAARAMLRGVLDERAARLAGKPAEPLDPAIQERLDAMPGGHGAISVQTMADTADGMLVMFEQMAAMEAEVPEEFMTIARSILGGLSKELKQLGLEHLVGTTTVTPTGMRGIWRW